MNDHPFNFALFYKENKNQIYNYAVYHLKDKDAAADIVQEAFLRLWNQKEKLDAQQNIKAYLYSICKNLMFDELKQNNRYSQYAHYIQQAGTPSENSTEDQQNYSELWSLYQEAIANLPLKRQQIFRMSRQSFRSNDDIALELQLSKNTVKDQIVKSNRYIKDFILRNSQSIPKKIFSLLIVLSSSNTVYILKTYILNGFKPL